MPFKIKTLKIIGINFLRDVFMRYGYRNIVIILTVFLCHNRFCRLKLFLENDRYGKLLIVYLQKYVI